MKLARILKTGKLLAIYPSWLGLVPTVSLPSLSTYRVLVWGVSVCSIDGKLLCFFYSILSRSTCIVWRHQGPVLCSISLKSFQLCDCLFGDSLPNLLFDFTGFRNLVQITSISLSGKSRPEDSTTKSVLTRTTNHIHLSSIAVGLKA